ncbi:hypothetical protein KDA_43420 [Dictyobacter alpinus]|uniref:HTH tetR-type domain-containing protein n=1 Tax=Dictyobacter alpinus TaxID=2014873 RepID=A0A402BBR0_9CHLR|nr:TetR family transcriptional regulator [Dictyobacter alpinus]GCE28858.1 hypothetical protein KDA_43420 [Dictyobacter alpinus]
MVERGQETMVAAPESSRREERAKRILDVATTLILRWGYAKTTLNDIASEAGVGKGTLYLHWKSREELFEALITREKIEMAEEIRVQMEQDPQGATLHGILKYSALALLKRPLLKALLLRDTDMLGKLAHDEKGTAAYMEQISGFVTYLQLLREQGLVRTDLSLQLQVYTFSAIFTGFFLVARFLPAEFLLSDELLAEMMAETARRTLEPGGPSSSNAFQAASQAFSDFMDRAVANAQEQSDHTQEFTAHLSTKRGPGRVRGRKGGRPKKLQTDERITLAQRLYTDTDKSIEEICATLGISRASLYRYMKERPERES